MIIKKYPVSKRRHVYLKIDKYINHVTGGIYFIEKNTHGISNKFITEKELWRILDNNIADVAIEDPYGKITVRATQIKHDDIVRSSNSNSF